MCLGDACEDFDPNAGDKSVANIDKIRHSNGGTPTSVIRSEMQKIMQNHGAVFRTQKTLEQGVAKILQCYQGSYSINHTYSTFYNVPVQYRASNWFVVFSSNISAKGELLYKPLAILVAARQHFHWDEANEC